MRSSSSAHWALSSVESLRLRPRSGHPRRSCENASRASRRDFTEYLQLHDSLKECASGSRLSSLKGISGHGDMSCTKRTKTGSPRPVSLSLGDLTT
eukprot:9471035-Pyramimonas_sp.AAC.1